MRPEDESNCRCCKDCSDFKQIIELKNVGIVIYRHSSHLKEVDGKSDYEDVPTGDMYILHNTSNIDITTNQYFSELGKYIKCARCKYLFEHAEKLIKKVSHIDKFGLIGLCDYCKNRIPCEHCYEVLKKFIASKNKETKIKDDFIKWLNNVKYYLKDHKLQSRSLSNLHLNNKRHFTLDPKVIHGMGQYPESLRDTAQTKKKQQQYDLITGSLNGTPIDDEKPENENKKSKRYFFDTNSNLIEHSDIDFYVQYRKIKFPSKYTHISQDNINVNVHDMDLLNLLHRRNIKSFSFNNLDEEFKSSDKPKTSRSHTQLTQNIETKRTNVSSIELNSQEEIMKFDDGVGQRSLEKDFSFVFIKPNNKQLKPPSKYKSSSELIKDTKDMIRERLEKEKKKPFTEIKLQEKKKKVLKEDKKKPEIQNHTLIEKTKEHEPLGDDFKMLDIETKKDTTDKPESEKKIKRKISELSLTSTKKDKKKKLEQTNKIVANGKREIPEKNVIEKEQKLEGSEQRNKTKKEPPSDLNTKDELNIAQHNLKNDVNKTNKVSSAKDQIDDFKKLLAEQKKQKEAEEKLKKKEVDENLKKKDENKQIKDDIKPKQEAITKPQNVKEPKPDKKSELTTKTPQNVKEPKPDKKSELTTKTETKFQDSETNDIKINQVKVRNPSCDDLILRLVRLKQTQDSQKERVIPKRLSEIKIDPNVINAHKHHQTKKQSNCEICNNSEIELDIEYIDKSKYKTKEVTDIIIGQQIFKYKPHLEENMNEAPIGPILFKSTFRDDVLHIPNHDKISNIADGDIDRNETKTKPLSTKVVEQEVPKGVIRYALSDRTFIDKGWTMLPTEKVVRKMNVYRMRPAHPEFDWFEHNKNKKFMYYDTGEKLAEFDDDGRGRWFYKNGKLALDYYDAKEINAQQRFVIYSSGEPDERGRSRPLVILATFDYLGNGIVFDHAGKIRLKYNQTEGVVLDRSIGPVSHWKWHTLNDPPVLQQVMIDTQMAHKDPEILKLGGPGENKVRADNEEMLAIEFDNFIKEKSKKLSQKFKPFQIKMKALKINEHFSLKVLDQATVYLIFRDSSTNLKINIGMILDHKEIVDTDTAEVGEVSNSLERFPARTDSLAGLQKSVAYAQRVERARVERERRLRPMESYTDKVNAIVSRPLRTPLNRVPASSTVTSSAYRCKCRKSSSCDLYYDTRLT